MQYKTSTLELLEEQQSLHEHLRRQGRLMAVLNQLATELRECHLQVQSELQDQQAGKDSGVSSQAMEIAIAELRDRLLALGEDSDCDFPVLQERTALQETQQNPR